MTRYHYPDRQMFYIGRNNLATALAVQAMGPRPSFKCQPEIVADHGFIALKLGLTQEEWQAAAAAARIWDRERETILGLLRQFGMADAVKRLAS